MALYTAGATGGTYNDGHRSRHARRAAVGRVPLHHAIGDEAPQQRRPHAVAERARQHLAYLVTGGPPDQTLLDIAASGGLVVAGRPRDPGAATARGARPGGHRMVQRGSRVARHRRHRRHRQGRDGLSRLRRRPRTSMDTESQEVRRTKSPTTEPARSASSWAQAGASSTAPWPRSTASAPRATTRAHEPPQADRHTEPGGLPVRVRTRRRDGAGAARRGGDAPGGLHEHAEPA